MILNKNGVYVLDQHRYYNQKLKSKGEAALKALTAATTTPSVDPSFESPPAPPVQESDNSAVGCHMTTSIQTIRDVLKNLY